MNQLILLTLILISATCFAQYEIELEKLPSIITNKEYAVQLSQTYLNGNNIKMKDIVSFKNDKISNSFGDQKGFEPALCNFEYDSTSVPVIFKFTAESKNSTEGLLRWSGKIIGTMILGMVYWEKGGLVESAFDFKGI